MRCLCFCKDYEVLQGYIFTEESMLYLFVIVFCNDNDDLFQEQLYFLYEAAKVYLEEVVKNKNK